MNVNVGWLAIIILSVLAIGTVLLTLQTIPGNGDELAKLHAEMRERAREHQYFSERLRNMEKMVNKIYNNSLVMVREVKSLHPTTTTTPVDLHKSFNLAGTEKGGGAEFLIITDEGYLKLFFRQAMAMRCYAWLNGYTLTLLDASENCPQRIFFFKKHCTVAEYLAKKPPGHTVIVMDGDTIPVDLHRRMDPWLSGHEDLIFYEREWSPEVAAGNYVARNSEFSRRFLHEWALLEDKRPPGAIFSGEDNGAIHVLLPDAVGVPCADVVAKLYGGLKHVGINVSDMARIPLEYKEFVAAAEYVRGPARRWVNVSRWKLRGNITVLPRMHAWVADNGVTQSKGSKEVGSVFHHGVKTADEVARYFNADGLQQCAVLPTAIVSKAAFLHSMMHYLTTIREHYGAWGLPGGKLVPFHDASSHCCIRNLSCRPLEPGEPMEIGEGKQFLDPTRSGRGAAGGKGPWRDCLEADSPPPKLPKCDIEV